MIVANVVLNKTKSNNGWIVITVGWGSRWRWRIWVGRPDGAHLNPAVTIGLAAILAVSQADVPLYIAAQLIDAFVGASSSGSFISRTGRSRQIPISNSYPRPVRPFGGAREHDYGTDRHCGTAVRRPGHRGEC